MRAGSGNETHKERRCAHAALRTYPVANERDYQFCVLRLPTNPPYTIPRQTHLSGEPSRLTTVEFGALPMLLNVADTRFISHRRGLDPGARPRGFTPFSRPVGVSADVEVPPLPTACRAFTGGVEGRADAPPPPASSPAREVGGADSGRGRGFGFGFGLLGVPAAGSALVSWSIESRISPGPLRADSGSPGLTAVPGGVRCGSRKASWTCPSQSCSILFAPSAVDRGDAECARAAISPTKAGLSARRYHARFSRAQMINVKISSDDSSDDSCL